MRRAHFLLILVILIFASCTSTTGPERPLVERLSDRGPVALSSTNPFLAANQLVAHLRERSSVVDGFIEHRGVPPIIEVEDSTFSADIIYFYYPEEREAFIVEETQGSWIIQGPERIPQIKVPIVGKLYRGTEGIPVLATSKELESAQAPDGPSPSPTADLMESTTIAPEPVKNTPEPAFSPVKKPVATPAPQKTDPQLKKLQPEKVKQQAELTPKGDFLVHHVVSDKESFELIAYWYTHDRTNAERLARMNKSSIHRPLTPGESVLVPSYMLKYRGVMPDEAIKLLHSQP